jgi:Domain of unknown function (DUF4291)
VTTHEQRQVLAACTATTITVYQAYSPQIAEAAVRAGTFVAPFSTQRMTWIKPSFGWMMHRCGWARKPGQERVLAIGISRAGFEWALAHSCLSHFAPGTHDSREAWEAVKASSSVRVQWDPDRSLAGQRLPRRAIQIGLSGPAIHRYVEEWIVSITDITPLVHEIEHLVRTGRIAEATQQLPAEPVYPLSPTLARRAGANTGEQPADDRAAPAEEAGP